MNRPNPPDSIPLFPGQPGKPSDELHTPQLWGCPIVRNVAQPTLLPFFPDRRLFNGTAVVVCPGGAWHYLMIDKEGVDVARWLNSLGMAAFVLKYRLVPTAKDDAEFERQVENIEEMIRQASQVKPLGILDGLEAIKTVRQQAPEWGIQRDRIGIMGFSAGGFVAVGAAIEFDPDSRPDFAAAIYPASTENLVAPVNAPPLFIAYANDDALIADSPVSLYTAWKAADRPVELHSYSKGGHGFGILKQGYSCDHWADHFANWLGAEKFIP